MLGLKLKHVSKGGSKGSVTKQNIVRNVCIFTVMHWRPKWNHNGLFGFCSRNTFVCQIRLEVNLLLLVVTMMWLFCCFYYRYKIYTSSLWPFVGVIVQQTTAIGMAADTIWKENWPSVFINLNSETRFEYKNVTNHWQAANPNSVSSCTLHSL